MKKTAQNFKKSYSGKLFLHVYKKFFEKRPLLFYFLIGLLLNFGSLIAVSFRGQPQYGKIPLHYVIGEGVTKTGEWYLIYFIPAILFLILVINFFIAKTLRKKEEYKASYVIVSATLLLEAFGMAASAIIANI